ARVESYELRSTDARRRNHARAGGGNFRRVSRISHSDCFPRRVVRTCLPDRGRFHRGLHCLCLAHPSRIAHESWYLRIRQPGRGSDRGIFSGRRDGRSENLAGNASGADQRDCDYHHPRHEACCPVPGETTARTGGRVIPLSGVTELATEEPRHTVPKSLPEIFGWAGKCRSRWIALDLIHLLESRRNLEERGVERA